MRTNIEINDKLIKDTLKITGLRTKREVVELGLETLLRLKRQEVLAKKLRGKVKWEGDLEAMRLDK
ncbi:MAG: type II toxin-antitoxin system VapB family antitoxin [Acidobacteria bacterium]|nr:type II toxin-antitoxin system VapB family antitoxin [Acidobacteriota bacterium]